MVVTNGIGSMSSDAEHHLVVAHFTTSASTKERSGTLVGSVRMYFPILAVDSSAVSAKEDVDFQSSEIHSIAIFVTSIGNDSLERTSD